MRSRYVEQTMSTSEHLIFETRLHWAMFWWVIFLIPFFPPYMQALMHHDSFAFQILVIVALIVIPSIIKYETSEFTVTNKRLVVKVGWLRRRTIELNMDKIESVVIDQGIFGRWLNYGTVVFTGIGATKEPFKKVAYPFELRAAVMDAMSK